jgi:hypothetical protein
MQIAMSTHRANRNLPCWRRYVLHVSQIVFETVLMDLCTGRFLVCTYCSRPNSAPSAHTTNPSMSTVFPVSEPPRNETACRSGMLMSDSLARAGDVAASARTEAQANQGALMNFMGL